jgi:putative ABC transport system permease protein
MFKHLFTLIWNKKKQNALLLSEILVSFMVIFAVFTMIVYYYQNYKKPMGMEYENVWVVNYSNNSKPKNADSLVQFYEAIRRTVKSMPEVKEFCYSSQNIPFSQTTVEGFVEYNKAKNSHINWFQVGDGYEKVLSMNLIDGRWFDKGDLSSKDIPVLINTDLKDKLFGNENAIGRLLGKPEDRSRMKVIGVVTGTKIKGDYAPAGLALYQRLDTSSFQYVSNMMLLVSPLADANFEGRLYKTLANSMKDSNLEIEHLTNKRKNINYFTLVPMIVLLIVSGFLIINVALGLFGVLWYNINKRKGEIALRRAVGASGNSVSGQLVSEALIIATLSIIVGVFFAVQFPILRVFDLPAGVYLTALFLSVLFIYGLVLVCALYPGKQAASIYPAVALHED